MVGPFLLVDVMYTHFPSGDQAPDVQDPLGGPTSCGIPPPWKGTTWQGRNTPRASISTTSTEWPSGERYEWCAIPRSLGGAYTMRRWPRPRSVVTISICSPSASSEKSRLLPLSSHDSEEALGKVIRGSPPRTGTSQLSHGGTVPYATLEPSGEKVGLNLGRESWVS